MKFECHVLNVTRERFPGWRLFGKSISGKHFRLRFPRVFLWEPSQKWSLVWWSVLFLISTWEQISNQSLRGLNKLEYKSPCKPLRTLISWHVCEKREMDSHKPHFRNFQQPIEGYKKLDFCLLGLKIIWPSFRLISEPRCFQKTGVWLWQSWDQALRPSCFRQNVSPRDFRVLRGLAE